MISVMGKGCFLITLMATKHLPDSDPELQIPVLVMQIKVSAAIQLRPDGILSLAGLRLQTRGGNDRSSITQFEVF